MRLNFKKILCAIDFSGLAPGMLHFAVGVAHRFEARLLVFHTVLVPKDQLYANPIVQRKQEVNRKRARALEKIKNLMKDFDIDWEPVVASGDPVEEVFRAVEENSVDLVMAASQGIKGFRRLLMGTVVERMARGLHCPFFVIRPSKKAIAPDPEKILSLEKIIAGCGLSEDTSPVLHHAQYFARKFKSRLFLLHTMESPVSEEITDETVGHYNEVQEALKNRLRDRLMGMVSEEVFRELDISPVLSTGIPSEAIISLAREEKADLVIVGVRGHGAIEKFLVGSTTEAVIRHCPCPVLIISPFKPPVDENTIEPETNREDGTDHE